MNAACGADDALLAAALRHAPEAVTIIDLQGPGCPLVFCNEAFCTLTGYAVDELLGRRLEDLLTDAAARGELTMLVQAASGRAEVQMRRRNGTLFWSTVAAAPIGPAGHSPTHAVVSLHDVSSHRERDGALQMALTQAERANWAKTRLIAVAGHDLRQPLQAITAALELLAREQALSERGRRVLSHAEFAAADLDEELNGLAQVAGVKQDLAPRLESFPLWNVLNQVARAWRPRAEYKGLELRVAETDVWVRSDPVMLRTILRNLVGNAIKYTARGRVLVGVRRSATQIHLEVWDTGPGVAPNMVSKIFEAFERADAPGEGLGLGLWIVQRTAELLDHPVSLNTRPQHGSCFRVCLPRAPAI